MIAAACYSHGLFAEQPIPSPISHMAGSWKSAPNNLLGNACCRVDLHCLAWNGSNSTCRSVFCKPHMLGHTTLMPSHTPALPGRPPAAVSEIMHAPTCKLHSRAVTYPVTSYRTSILPTWFTHVDSLSFSKAQVEMLSSGTALAEEPSELIPPRPNQGRLHLAQAARLLQRSNW